MFVELMMLSNHRPLLLLPSIFPSIRVLSNESVLCIRWPKYWSFSISPSNKYIGLISFRIDWFDLLSVQGTLKSLLQHLSLKVLILWHTAFFMVQLFHLDMTTGKTMILTIQHNVSAFWYSVYVYHNFPSKEYSGLISFRIDWFDHLAVSKRLSRVFSSTSVWKHQFFGTQPSLCPTLPSIHDCWKTHSFDYTDICWQSDVSAF